MTIESALCIVFLAASFTQSKSIAMHYAAALAVNLALVGAEFADSSLLTMMFASLAMLDAVSVLAGGRKVLLVSAATYAVLCLESMLNMDWLLNQSTYISAAVNAVIAASLIKGYWNWTHGK